MNWVEYLEETFAQLLLRSVKEGPLLVGNLPGAPVWEFGTSSSAGSPHFRVKQRLGHLFEDVFATAVKEAEAWELLARNVQVFAECGRTLGELDFLVRDVTSSETFHIELAVKFYLAWKDPTGAIRFPGPDPRDDWNTKLERMLKHQFVLSRTNEAQAMLAERFGVEMVRVAQRIYGIVFDHFETSIRSEPPGVAAASRRSCWLYLREWDRCYGELEEVAVIPKFLWPANLTQSIVDQLAKSPIQAFKAQARLNCTLFWDPSKRAPVFVVPDSWPRVERK